MTLLPERSWEKYTSIHKMGLTITISFPWSCEGRRYIIAKEDLLTASCDSCQPFPRHHLLASCIVHTPEISGRNTWNKERKRSLSTEPGIGWLGDEDTCVNDFSRIFSWCSCLLHSCFLGCHATLPRMNWGKCPGKRSVIIHRTAARKTLRLFHLET